MSPKPNRRPGSRIATPGVEALSTFLRDDHAGHPVYVVEDDERLRVLVVLGVLGVPPHDRIVPVIAPVWLPGPSGMEWVAGIDEVDFHRVMGRHCATWRRSDVDAVFPGVEDASLRCLDQAVTRSGLWRPLSTHQPTDRSLTASGSNGRHRSRATPTLPGTETS